MQDSAYLLETTNCVMKICEKMDNWCCGEGVDEVYEEVNKKYEALKNADYIGKLTTFKKINHLLNSFA